MAQWQQQFSELGINVVAMSYDSVEVLAQFHAEAELDYPLLQDIAGEHVKALGVLNEEYEPGHRAYGIPHPGILFVTPDETVGAKFAVPGFRERPPFESVHSALSALLAHNANDIKDQQDAQLALGKRQGH